MEVELSDDPIDQIGLSAIPVDPVECVACGLNRQGWDVTGGEGSFTQWVHCEFVVSFEAIRPVITQQVCGEFF